MRATQKKMISKEVTSVLVGYHFLKAGVFSGQPSVEKGQRALENQVSRTSGSWISSPPSHREQADGGSAETMGCAERDIRSERSSSPSTSVIASRSQRRQYQAGIRWPHQSWRETHQSRIFRIHSK